MDSALLDCFTPDSRPRDAAVKGRGQAAIPAFGGLVRAVEREAAAMSAGAGPAAFSAQDALIALAVSLPEDVRKACAERAEKRAFPQFADASDPCVCGEALLLVTAAGQGRGRAPLSAFRPFGEWL